MSYGIQVTMENGETFDTNAFSCNTYDLFTYTTGSGTYTKQYPELVGYNIYAFIVRANANALDASAGISISYPSGVPTVTCTTIVGPTSVNGNNGTYATSNIYVVVS